MNRQEAMKQGKVLIWRAGLHGRSVVVSFDDAPLERSLHSRRDGDAVVGPLKTPRITGRVRPVALFDEGFTGDVAGAKENADPTGEAVLGVDVHREPRGHVVIRARLGPA